MLWKIIALAIAGLSSAAFAQSTVTLSGLVDGGYYSQSMQTSTIMDTKTAFAVNGSSTSALFLTVTEDLGNGMKARFFGESDWQPGGVAAAAGTGLLNSYTYLELSGGFGSVKGGILNTAALYATIAAQPFGTGIGSGISGAFGRLSRAGSNGTFGTGTAGLVTAEGENATAASTTVGIAGARSVRVNNSLSYTTPSFSGFTAGLQWAAKNADSAVAAAGNSAGFMALNAAYNNGPINVHFVNEQTSAGSVAAPAAGIGAALGANEKITHNILAGNYTMGPATIYAGWSSSKSSGVAVQTADSRSWNLGLKYAVSGALSLAGQVLRVDDKLVGNQDRNLNALGLDYAISKRTTAYGRYETGDNDKSSVTGNSIGGFSRWQAGMKHTF
jgi:predicted porin